MSACATETHQCVASIHGHAGSNFGDACNYYTQEPDVPRGAKDWYANKYATTDGTSAVWCEYHRKPLLYSTILHESLSTTIVTYGLRLICRPKAVLSQLHGGRFGDILGARAHEFVHDAWSTMFAHRIRRFAFAFSSVAAVSFSLHHPVVLSRLR